MRRQGYLFRQLVKLIAAVSLPLIALVSWNMYQGWEQTKRAAYQAVEKDAWDVARDSSLLLENTERYLGYLALRPLVNAVDSQSCDPLLEGATQRRRHLANVLVTDLLGRPVCLAVHGPGAMPVTYAEFPWFVEASRLNGISRSKPFLAPVAQRMASAVSLPLRDSTGRRTGTVTALIDLESIGQEFARRPLPLNSRLTLFDKDGTVLATNRGARDLIGTDASRYLKAALLAYPEAVGMAPGIDGVQRVFALKRLSVGDWQAAATMPEEAVFAAPRAQFIGSVALTLAVLVTVLGLALLMARRLAAPLKALAAAARSVEKGDDGVMASEQVPGEFNILAKAFNAMLEAQKRFRTRELRQVDFYAALSRTNGAIVRMPTPQALFREICRICVEHGHASICYVSLLEGERLVPVAHAGPAAEFLASVQLQTRENGNGHIGLSGEAARTGDRQVSNNILTDPRTAPFREAGKKIGTRAVAAFAFSQAGKTVGTLTLHMTVPGFFDEKVLNLVDEMASDISFALDNFARDKQRDEAEKNSLAAFERFMTVFQTAPAGMTISNVGDESLVYVNEAFGQFVDQAPTLLIGQHAFNEKVWPGPAERKEFIAQLTKVGRVRNFELRGHDGHGSPRDYLLQADYIDFENQPCVLTVASDVTELRESQQRVVRQEQRLSGLVDTAMDAIISVDADSLVVLFNRAAAELFQVSQADALGTHIERFIPARLRRAHEVNVSKFAQTGGTSRRMGALDDLVGLRSDGVEFPVEASISRFSDGESVVMTVVLRDATESRRAAEARLAQATAESASRAKTTFLSRMSHELRTPLNAILGFAQLLKEDEGAALSASQLSHVEHITRAGWHLLALINDVLDVTTIEAGKVTVAQHMVDIVELLDAAVRFTEGVARARNVEVLCIYRQQPAVYAVADPRRLTQVLINLLSNAIKYNRPTGKVVLRTSANEDTTIIEVVDTGLGMSKAQLEHLYEPFNRLGREAQGTEGTGLGMALSKELLHLMGGDMTVSSESEVGTTVQVSLPKEGDHRSIPAALDAVEEAQSSEDSPQGVVLYIEDNPVNMVLVQHLLLRWKDVTLLQAETGRDGLAIAQSTKPDVILLDMRLPDIDGLQVLAEFAAHADTRECKVVALSASAMPEEVDAALKAGATDYWTKPLDFARFISGMQQLLRPA